MEKTLVAYFSVSGHTESLAREIARAASGDMYKIEPAVPYTGKDLDWRDETSRTTLEMKDKNARPAIKEGNAAVKDYDRIFLGFPIWWYEAPRIISTFLESYDFSGKKIIPFGTSGGSNMAGVAKILSAVCPNAVWKNGSVFGLSTSYKEIEQWVEKQ